MALRDTSLIWKGNVCFQAAALIISLVGFGTNYLVLYEIPHETVHGGLWQVSATGITDDMENTGDFLRVRGKSPEWLLVSKVMMTISFSLHILCIIFTLVFAAITSTITNSNRMLLWAVAVGEFAAGMSGLIGCSVAVSNLKSDLEDLSGSGVTFDISWSFSLFLVAQFAFVISGLLTLLDARLRFANRSVRSAPTMNIASVS